MKNTIHDAGGWKLRLRFKAGEARKVSRCACDAKGVPSGRARSTGYCPVTWMDMVWLEDEAGHRVQIGTDSMSVAPEEPPNAGVGLTFTGRGGFFADEPRVRRHRFREDSMASVEYVSAPFETHGEFRTRKLCVPYWEIAGADGKIRRFVNLKGVSYAGEKLKFSVATPGYLKSLEGIWMETPEGRRELAGPKRPWQKPKSAKSDTASRDQDFRKARELYRAGKITMDEALALATKS